MIREDMEFFEKLFRSLETEMNRRFDDVNSRFDAVNHRFDRLESRMTQMTDRMDRIGGLVNGGSRALAKMIEWTEHTDVTLADVLRRQDDLDQRLRKLESGNASTT